VALSEYFQKGKVGEQACQPYHTDPTYEDSGDDFNGSASEDFEMGPVIARTPSTIPDNDAMDLDWTANNVRQLLNPLVVTISSSFSR